jgi:rhodanese-related sulfurtransferase
MRSMKTLIVAITLVVPFLARAQDKDIVELTPQQVAQAISEKNVYVFDNTDSDSFKAGHVPGAKLLHPGQFSSKDLPTNKSATLIFYCYNKF